MTTKHTENKLRFFLYFLWFGFSLSQAYLTLLTKDEAYYWKFSRFLDWGYFDHPPVIALLIRIGYFFFHNELGVRLIPALLVTASVYFLEKLLRPGNIILFFVMVFSVGILQYIGFAAIPDSPLLFFSVLFFLLLKRFLNNQNAGNAALLGISIGLVLLSKYHGILIIAVALFFLFRSYNFSKPGNQFNFLLLILIPFLLFLPHILWQYNHNFPTLYFHLVERSRDQYKLSYTLEYIFTQPFVFGPFMGFIFLFSAYKYRPVDTFEKILKGSVWFVYLFFFLMTFKGRNEAYWTLPALIPAFCLSYNYALQSPKLKKVIYSLFPLTLLLIISARVILFYNILPYNKFIGSLTRDYFYWDKWAKTIKVKAGNKPVVFLDSYKKAALYEFYSGSPAITFNYVGYRKDQYDIWNYEDSVRGKDVLYIGDYIKIDNNNSRERVTQTTFIDNFQSFSNVNITPLNFPQFAYCGDTLSVKLIMKSRQSGYVNINDVKDEPSLITYQFFYFDDLKINYTTSIVITNQMVNDPEIFYIKVAVPPVKGTYRFSVSIQTGILPPAHNSDFYKISIL